MTVVVIGAVRRSRTGIADRDCHGRPRDRRHGPPLAARVGRADWARSGDRDQRFGAAAPCIAPWARQPSPIFGPTVPEFGFGPLADSAVVAANASLACRPCDPHGPQRCPLGPLAMYARDYSRRGSLARSRASFFTEFVTMPTKKRNQYIIGVDLGGTNIVVGAMSSDGKHHLAVRTISTSAELGAEAVADRIVGLIEGVILDTIADTKATRKDFIGVGIGAPGPLDREQGIVIVAPNLGWRNFPLRDRIVKRLNLPATLDNDANCATVGEWWQGAASGGTNVIGLTIGTGIGGGLIIDGKLYHGASDVAGEIGHTTIDLNGPPLQVRQLRLPRGVRLGSGHRRPARARSLVREEDRVAAAVAGRRPPRPHYRADGLRGGAAGRCRRQRDRARHRALPRHGRCESAEHLQPRRRRRRWRRDAGGRRAVRAATRRGAAPGVHAQQWRRCASCPGMLPGTAGVVGAVATFKMQYLGEL